MTRAKSKDRRYPPDGGIQMKGDVLNKIKKTKEYDSRLWYEIRNGEAYIMTCEKGCDCGLPYKDKDGNLWLP